MKYRSCNAQYVCIKEPGVLLSYTLTDKTGLTNEEWDKRLYDLMSVLVSDPGIWSWLVIAVGNPEA